MEIDIFLTFILPAIVFTVFAILMTVFINVILQKKNSKNSVSTQSLDNINSLNYSDKAILSDSVVVIDDEHNKTNDYNDLRQ